MFFLHCSRGGLIRGLERFAVHRRHCVKLGGWWCYVGWLGQREDIWEVVIFRLCQSRILYARYNLNGHHTASVNGILRNGEQKCETWMIRQREPEQIRGAGSVMRESPPYWCSQILFNNKRVPVILGGWLRLIPSMKHSPHRSKDGRVDG